MTEAGKPAAVSAVDDDADLQALTQTVNELISYTQSAVSSASLKAKEMEIRMKVAIADRRHAESILYSINECGAGDGQF